VQNFFKSISLSIEELQDRLELMSVLFNLPRPPKLPLLTRTTRKDEVLKTIRELELSKRETEKVLAKLQKEYSTLSL